MKLLLKVALSLLCGIRLFVGPASATEDIVIVFGEHGYPPFYSERAQKGMFIDLLAEFEKRNPNYKIIKKSLSRKMMDRWMNNGKAHVFSLNNPMFVNPNIVDRFLFTAPIWNTGDYVVMHKERQFEYTQPKDLFGKKMGIILGNGYGVFDEHLESKSILSQAVNSENQLFMLLLKQRVDAIFGNRHATPYKMKRTGIDPSQFVFSKVAIFEFDLMIQVQKSHQAFYNKIQAFIQAVQTDGFLAQLEHQYLK